MEPRAKRPALAADEDEDPATTRFREYLRIRSVQPDPDYASCVAFLRRMADEIGLEFQCYEFCPNRPIVLMSWQGTSPSLSSILLNSHMDVVPVFEDKWDSDPFGADKRDGRIYARGTQDMKCVGMQYLEAIRRLKSEGQTFLRTFHVSFVPDEEIGGKKGMEQFIDTEQFKALNVGFGLDEGMANPTEAFTVFYGERAPLWLKMTCQGNPGHGSLFIENTAAEKLQCLMNHFLEFRASEKARLESDPELHLGDVTSCNMTMLSGGVQPNVVPDKLTACFDLRISPRVSFKTIDDLIDKWLQDAGEGVSMEVLQRWSDQTMTVLSDENVWWKTFESVCLDLNMKLDLEIFPAATDIRFVRRAGIPALGFSPMNNTPVLLHDHNEYLAEDVYLRGIEIYLAVLPALANVKQ